ncbi:MAG TPA: biopolymer transporter ExbD [Flavobacteriales bacterium]|nr:biopolymer transporter ExbD [Flavobacteriales bacterium]
MAEIIEGGGKKGKARAKRQPVKIDMTPMVDLAFLLLTFFILTTTLVEQKTLDILLLVESEPAQNVNNGITIILSGNNQVFYYTGKLKADTKLVESDFKNIRLVIQEKNQPVIQKIKAYLRKHPGIDFENDTIAKNAKNKILSSKHGVFVIIKYDSLARYRNAIDMIDEMDICWVPTGRYAVINKLEPAEKVMLKKAKNLTRS